MILQSSHQCFFMHERGIFHLFFCKMVRVLNSNVARRRPSDGQVTFRREFTFNSLTVFESLWDVLVQSLEIKS